jgi:hypothetical protein
MFLNIHLEFCDDKGERLLKIAEFGKPFSISVVPVLFVPNHRVFSEGVYPSELAYSGEVVDILKELVRSKDVFFGQQGLSHYCPECLKEKGKKSPHHENMCLYGKAKSVSEQVEFMSEGGEIIKSVLGVSPRLYTPPNHQYDGNSIIAARRLGFDFFVVRRLIEISPYKEKGLIILPESKLGEAGEIVYAHYDETANKLERYSEIIRQSSSLYNITPPTRQSQSRIQENYNRLLLAKQRRDIKKRSAD